MHLAMLEFFLKRCMMWTCTKSIFSFCKLFWYLNFFIFYFFFPHEVHWKWPCEDQSCPRTSSHSSFWSSTSWGFQIIDFGYWLQKEWEKNANSTWYALTIDAFARFLYKVQFKTSISYLMFFHIYFET